MKKYKHFEYDNMKIIVYNDILYCLSYKDKIYCIKNIKENELIINKSLYQNYELNIFNNKTFFEKVKKFLVYYFSIHINNKKDFENFINYCFQYNEYKIKKYDSYFYDWIKVF